MLEPITTPVHRCRTGLSAMLAGALTLVVTATPAMAAPEAESTAEQHSPKGSSPREPASGPLRIDVDSTVDDADLLREWIASRNAGITEKIPVFVGHEQWIAVEIGGATYDYSISVVGMRDGKPLGVAEAQGCVCTSEKLLGIIDKRIDVAANELQESPSDPPPPEDPREDTVVVRPPPDEPHQRNDRARRIGASGYVGIATIVLGAGATGAGLALLKTPDTPTTVDGSVKKRTSRTPGIALAIGGGAAVIAGITMVIASSVQQRRRAIVVTPILGPQRAGLSFSRLF